MTTHYNLTSRNFPIYLHISTLFTYFFTFSQISIAFFFNSLSIVGDIVLAVNSITMDGLTHADAVQLLKSAGRRAEITIKRKAIVKVPVNGQPKAMPRAKSREYLETNRDSESDRTYNSSRSRTKTRDRSYSDDYSEEDSRYNKDSRSRTRGRSQSRGRNESRGRDQSRGGGQSRGRNESKGRTHNSRPGSRSRSRSRSASYSDSYSGEDSRYSALKTYFSIFFC